MDDQYPRAVEYADEVIRYFNNGEGKSALGKSLRFYTTGHSLGGGLAQHVLYARPKEFLQAFAFDPSSVTGFVDVPHESQIAGCSCVRSLGAEARIYRFYESYEVLTHLRFVHKLFFAPNHHIQEVRFGFSSSPNLVGQHSMAALADSLNTEATRRPVSEHAKPWYSGIGKDCTARFEEGQRHSCSVVASGRWVCPQ